METLYSYIFLYVDYANELSCLQSQGGPVGNCASFFIKSLSFTQTGCVPLAIFGVCIGSIGSIARIEESVRRLRDKQVASRRQYARKAGL